MYVAVARQLDLPLVTFDVDQHQRAGEWIAVHSIE
jgi:predicted nucleic acid-binding protein